MGDRTQTRQTREIDELIASAMRLRTAMSRWDATQFANEVGMQYKTLHSLIPIPTNPASASASASPSKKAAYTSFYAKIRTQRWMRLGVTGRSPFFPDGQPLGTPLYGCCSRPQRGQNPFHDPAKSDPPVLQQLLLEAFLKHGDLKMAVSIMSGKNSDPVPLFDPTSKDKGKGRGNASPLRQFLTSENEIYEFAIDLMGHIPSSDNGVNHVSSRSHTRLSIQWRQSRLLTFTHAVIDVFTEGLLVFTIIDLMGHIPSSDNGINHVSSRVHVVVDAFTEGLLVFTIIDLCGDESSEVRGRLTSANKESSDRIANDLSFLKKVFTDLKLATAPSQPMNAESWRSQGIFGRECALTRAFLNRLALAPKLHIIMFGHGTSDQSRKDLIMSLKVWSPPVVAGRAIDDKPRAIGIGGKRSRANDVDGKRSKRPKFQR
ncbi:hypothetical protein Q9L58_009994 [Maublancomyces gigas]|uniref:Uncharacterized protein n=1 Tax=Discina gigas TaxID=1032678 RepID=A0ABR3G6F1_9PEZI